MDGFRVHLKGQGRGGNQSLRSPYVHRSDEFAVSLRGWLYRLEGAALKQWKRRWCVLADYCLFYYKDMAEEKMLGSLLLPSYKISPCFSRDGISRKFAFKAEHNNMKTYYFAADSKEIQQQWMNALSLASIMQLSAIFPNNFPSSNSNKNNSSNSNNTNANKSILTEPNPTITRNQDLPDDESGFLTFQAKRMEEESAIIYGSEYYNANFTGQSLNMYNSVGLPLVYSNPGPDINGYITAPPKPQRQYYNSLVPYEYTAPTMHGYKYNAPDLIGHNPPAHYYLEEGYDEYFPETNFVQPYPEFFPINNYPEISPNCPQNRPQRPHSADFLERNQDEELDEECQIAFQDDKLNYFNKNVSNLPPKIMPTRPKSSIERYDPFLKSQIYTKDYSQNSSSDYNKKALITQENVLTLENDSQSSNRYPQYSLTKFISNYGITENRYKDIDKTKLDQNVTNYGELENGTNGLPIRPPLPLEYESKFNYQSGEDRTITQNGASKSKVSLTRGESAGNETSYTSDDENKRLNQTNDSSKTAEVERKDLCEISKEEYYKASQLFYQRQKRCQIVPLNSSSNHSDSASVDSSNYAKNQFNAENDWNDIGLPLPNSNLIYKSNISLHQSDIHQNANHVKLADKTSAKASPASESSCCSTEIPKQTKKSSLLNVLNLNLPDNEQEVKFKIGVKVRTYKKPKLRSASQISQEIAQITNKNVNKTEALSESPACELFSKNVSPETSLNESKSIEKVTMNDDNKLLDGINEVGNNINNSVSKSPCTSAAAPYYYSDLLSEEQKVALQKKLGNFATPPPLLSRCPATNNARYLGMTSLKYKTKKINQKLSKDGSTNNGDDSSSVASANSNNYENENKVTETVETKSNHFPEALDGHKLKDGINAVTDRQSKINYQHLYQNYDCPKNFDTINNGSSQSLLAAHKDDSMLKQNLDLQNKTCPISTDSGGANIKPDKKQHLYLISNKNVESFCNQTSPSSSESIDSVREFNLKKTRKRRTKRKSNEGLNNVSDSEIQFSFDRSRKKRSLKLSKRRCVSAADYVGKSYEDLILMLIQLRRRQSDLSKSCDKLRLQMESEEKMMEIEPQYKDEYYFRFNELKQELLKVEKEYEFQMPIIESIDNMIKVKSKVKQTKLNKEKAASTSVLDTVVIESLELIGNFVKDREINLDFPNFLEINDNDKSKTSLTPETPNGNIENLKKQQKALEDELERVRGLLTHSTKKLEEKAVENAQMEQEMLIARTKLKQVLDNEQEAMEITRSSKLESELAHINNVIDDLHSRRKGLNTAIENLKNSERDILLPTSQQDEMSGLISNDTKFPMSYNKTDMVTMDIKDLAKYKDQLLSDAAVPLYENLNNAKKCYESEDNYPSSTKMFDHVNNNMTNANEENDDFFTLNINLDKAKPYEYGRAFTEFTESELASNSEINNNDLKQNLNTMCEFDPTKDLHMAYGDSIVDQQIRQIYNYQTSCAYPASQKSNDIKTVREVKRESERRKLNQQQQNYKFTTQYGTDQAGNKYGSYFQSNHYYNEAKEVSINGHSLPKNVDFDSILPNYHSNTILQNTQHIKTETDLNDELNRNSFNAPDIVQSTIKFNEDFCDKEVVDPINLAK